jgi:hypothetical protein
MAVTQLDIRSREPYENGAVFGDGGVYERVDGVIHFAVDAAAAANASITDIDNAERGPDGLVHILADFCLLQPVEPVRGQRRLLLDVVNRGRKNLTGIFNRSERPLEPSERVDPGDGFLMRRGWTLAWCGWQWDVVRSQALMGLEAPQAVENGRPIAGRVLVQFQPNERLADHVLCDRVHRPYPAADVEEPEAELGVRDWLDGPRTVIPRDQWRFARDQDGRPVADEAHVRLEGGFEPGRFYDVVYRTSICPVAGTGLLAIRDTAAFLRHADEVSGNPCAGRIDRAYAYGVSQTGRFLRHFLYLGLNQDEQGRQVFDGVLPHVAGARRGEFNHRYAQPSQQNTANFGHLMPFTPGDQTDPVIDRTDGWLQRQRALGGVPRIIATNTGAEYWRADGSLLHTDISGLHDVEPPDDMRIYYLAGTQHTRGALPLSSVNTLDGARGAHPFNVVDYSPLLRAALVNLDRWVTAAEEPPPSVFPRLSDKTAASPSDVIQAARRLPFAAVPMPERLKQLRRLDLGPDATRGVGRFPAVAGEAYPSYVPAVDPDGNEVGGVRLPDLSVPLATYTGWNPRHPETGGPGQIIDMLGSTLPFAATADERRLASGVVDPRPSIAERYRDRDDYLTRVRVAAEALAEQRYVLPEDVELLVRQAGERYDAFSGTQRAVAAAGTTQTGAG